MGFGAAGAKYREVDGHLCSKIRRMSYLEKSYRRVRFRNSRGLHRDLRRVGRRYITYVNTVASIVHAGRCVSRRPNKNIGCAFLLVWKICDGTLPGLRDLRDKDPPRTRRSFASGARLEGRYFGRVARPR